MAFLSSAFGPQTPVKFEVLPSTRGDAWIDVEKNGRINESDAFLTLETTKGGENLDFQDLKKALTAFAPGTKVSDKELVSALTKEYKDDSLQGTGVVTGGMCFDLLSTYRQKQTFEVDGDKIFYTLTPDPDAPFEKLGGGEKIAGAANVSLVKDADGILHWDIATPPAPAPDPDAVKEAVCVERDGILHWVFPGEKLEAGDKVIGNTDTFADNITKGRGE